MKKNLIPAAVLMAFAGAAQAQLSLYGLVDMSYGKSLFGDVFLAEKADFHSGGDNGSSEGNSTTRVGIKGGVDLGSGVKANFRFETGGINSDGGVNGGGNFFDRQAWFGFSGNFGEVRLGRQDSVSFQTMIDYDFNGASNGLSALGYTLTAPWLPLRQSRSLQYISPNLGGFTAQLGLVPKGNRGSGANNVFSAGLKYGTGPLSVAVSMQTKENSAAQRFMSAAGSYDFKVAKLMLGYADGGDFNKGGTGSGFSAGLVAPVGNFNVGVLLAQNTDDDLKLRGAEVFVNSEIFKSTYAYAEFGNWKTSKAANPLVSRIGSDPANAQRSGSGFAVGVIYVF
ncbi:MAG: porin [Ideonella sp. WA131b]|jgi:predicted porin|nr:porin [Ideonella sp. WA131b]